MLGKLLSRLFGPKPIESLPPLPSGAGDELRNLAKRLGSDVEASAIPKVLHAIQRRQKIEAIKELREGTFPSLGLKHSKDVVEALERRVREMHSRFGR